MPRRMHERMRKRPQGSAPASGVNSVALVATARDTLGVTSVTSVTSVTGVTGVTGANAVTDELRSCEPRDEHCHLCGDEAVVGRVLDIDHTARLATVDFGSDVATVALDLVQADVGDRLLVHLGFAIARLEPT